GKASDVEPWWRAHRLVIACAVIIVVVGSTVVIRQLTHNGREASKTVAVREQVNGPAQHTPPSPPLAPPAPSPSIAGDDQAAQGNTTVSGGAGGSGAAGDEARSVVAGAA